MQLRSPRLLFRYLANLFLTFFRSFFFTGRFSLLSLLLLSLFLCSGVVINPGRAHAEILYVSYDSSSATSTGLGPNAGNNPKYRIVGSFVATHDIDFNDATTSIVFEGTNLTGGVNFNVDFSTSTDSLYPSTPGVFSSFWPLSLAATSDGLPHQYTGSVGPGNIGANAGIVHSGETVYVLIYSTQGFPFATQSVTTDTPGTSFFGEIVYNETPVFGDGPTRIVATVPRDGTTVATSSAVTLGATIVVNTADWTAALSSNAGRWQVVQRLTSGAYHVTGSFGTAGTVIDSRTFTYPITTSGISVFSTTTSILAQGQYTLVTEIQKQPTLVGNILGFFGLNQQAVIVSTTTHFLAATSTTADVFYRNGSISNDLITNASTTAADCLTLALTDCLSYLFRPNPSSWQQFDAIDITHKPPLGYFFAVSDALSTTSASTTPSGAIPAVFLVVTTEIGSWFGAMLGLLTDIILTALAVWIFVRMSKWDWQQ